MLVNIDSEADAAYITLREGAVTRTQRFGPFVLDYANDGQLLGVEILSLRHRLDVVRLETLIGADLDTLVNGRLWLQAFAKSIDSAAAMLPAA